MWILDNRTPFTAECGFDRDAGHSYWLVWIKAGFDLRAPGQKCRYRSAQPEILKAPHHDPETGQLIAETETILCKPMVDLIATGEVPETVERVTLMMADWTRNIERDANEDDPDTDAPPFLAPLHAIPGTHPARSAWAGTYDAAWRAQRSPLPPIDFEATYWQSAASENRLSLDIAGPLLVHHDDEVAVETLLPLPVLTAVTRMDRAWHNMPVHLQTIFLDFRAGQIDLTFCAALPLSAPDRDVAVEKTVLRMEPAHTFTMRSADLKSLYR